MEAIRQHDETTRLLALWKEVGVIKHGQRSVC